MTISSNCWETKTFGECAELVRNTCQPSEFSNMPYIGLEHIEEGTLRLAETGNTNDVISMKSCFESGDILFGKLRPYFRKVIRPGFSGLCSTDIMVVRARQGIDQGFLFYWMASQEFVDTATRGSEGTKMPRAKWDFLQRIVKPIPPLLEQCAIAAILGTLDDKIELTRQMNQTLEAMAQALFKSWFVDFEPFQKQGMQESVLGPIPQEWRCATVSEAIEVNPSRRVEQGANAIYVDMAALPTASARILTAVRRAFSGSGSRFRNGDILLARITPCLENGKTAIVDFLKDGDNGWGSTEFIVLGPKPPLSTPFIYCLARNPDFRAHAIQAMTGTSGRQRVDTGCFNYYWLAVPPKSVAERFDHKVEPWFQMMKANDDESHALATIRDALLPKLVSGEIRVKDAEKFVEKAI
jgi:type I restriction enzyme, S subunit